MLLPILERVNPKHEGVTFKILHLKLNNLFLQYDKFMSNIFLILKECKYIL